MNNARRDRDWLNFNRSAEPDFCPINQPSHYVQGRRFEPIDVIEDWKLGFNLGNVLKYCSRAGRKASNSPLQDLKKALFYLQREVDTIEESVLPFDSSESIDADDQPLEHWIFPERYRSDGAWPQNPFDDYSGQAEWDEEAVIEDYLRAGGTLSWDRDEQRWGPFKDRD